MLDNGNPWRLRVLHVHERRTLEPVLGVLKGMTIGDGAAGQPLEADADAGSFIIWNMTRMPCRSCPSSSA